MASKHDMNLYRLFWLLAAAVFATAFNATVSHAQQAPWPPSVVKILVPLGPGGANDVVARLLAQHLQEKFKTGFVVENRIGAGGAVAIGALAKSPADGSTIGIVSTATNAILPALRSDLPYNPDKDLELVALLAEYPLVLVAGANVPGKTLAEFVAYGKANPEKLTFGSGGVGTAVHLAGEMFNATAGIKARHIPFKGTSEYVSALLGGHIDYAVDALINVAEPIRAGKLRAIAVTSVARFPELPDVPTVAETYPGFVAFPWGGLAAPAGTPRTVINALSGEVRAFLEMPETKAKLTKLWAVPAWKSSEDFQKYVAAERAKYAAIVRNSGIKIE
jgi:tripartite-type tricarboxylate transporter receptor subunit TctC